MTDEVPLAPETLADLLRRESQFGALVQQVCHQVARTVPGVHGAAIALVHKDEPKTVAATNQLLSEVDGTQYRTGQGPCLHARSTGQPVRAGIDEALLRWPRFAVAARTAGMGSFLSVPVMLDNLFSGAINCYSRHGHGFRDLDTRSLGRYVTTLEGALRSAQRLRQARRMAERLRTALISRVLLDQAKGVLMARNQLTADEALTLLVEQARREGVTLSTLAERVVHRRRL